MDTNKMREQFEAAYIAKCLEENPEAGVTIKDMHNARRGDEYVGAIASAGWWAWQASREAVVVELPEPHMQGSYTEPQVVFAEEIREAIQAQGLKVAL